MMEKTATNENHPEVNPSASGIPKPISTPSGFLSGHELMPTDEASITLLDRRKARLIDSKTNKSSKTQNLDTDLYIVFKMDRGGLCAIPHQASSLIVENTDITPVPCTPRHIAGIISFRGKLLSIIDFDAYVDGGITDPSSPIIIVKHKKKEFGLLVNNIVGNQYLSKNKQTDVASISDNKLSELTKGVLSNSITLLNLEILSEDDRLFST